MAAITSAGSGNANSTTPNAPWPSGIVPGIGDTVTIANGHTVTVTSGHTWSIGDASSPTTPAIRTAGTGGSGALVVHGIVYVYGDILQGPAQWTVESGGRVRSANTTTMLSWYVGDNNTAATLQMNGLGPGSASAVVEKGAGSAGFRIRHANVGGPSTKIVGQWARFFNLGDASTPGITIGFNTAAAEVDLDHVWIDGCGLVNNYINVRVDNLFRLRHCTVSNSQSSTGRSIQLAFTAGARSKAALFEDCSFDKLWKVDGLGALELRRVQMQGRVEINSTIGVCEDVMLCDQRGSGNVIAMYGTAIVRGMRVRVNPAAGNWHGITLSGTTGSVDGMIFDAAVADSTGDLIQTQGSGAIINHIKNVVVTKSSNSDGSYGKLCGIATATSSITSVTHNSHACASHLEGALVNVGETSAGSAGMVPTVEHNIALGVGAGSGLLFARLNAGAAGNITNAVTPGNVRDNVCPNPYAGGANVGPAARTSSGGNGIMFSPLPEAPIEELPHYVDDRRNLATWWRSLGGTPDTEANDKLAAQAAIASQNTDSPVAGATQMAAWRWIRAGKAPRNPRLHTRQSTENGGWPGAVEGNSHARYRARARRR